LAILEKEIIELSKTYDIPLSNIDVMGFSQGSIMTMGLLLRSNLKLNRYLCFSGRTLPEFSQFAYEHPEVVSGKKVFLTHGLYDDKLPVAHGRKSKEVLKEVKANFHYYEFPGGHQISLELLKEALRWSKERSWTEV
jgi:phospholipase/carboxylesterase